MTKIIAVANQKGGVGKTTTAVNLSAYLATRRKRVLLVDLDPQGNATSGLGINKEELENSVYDGLVNDVPFKDIIINTDTKNLDIIPSHNDLAGAEIELYSFEDKEIRLAKGLNSIKASYNYIIIDCPPSLGQLSISAFTAANSILITMQCEYFALEGLSRVTDTLLLIKEHINPGLGLEGILLTMADSRTKQSREIENDVREHFGKSVFKTVIPRSIRFAEAPSHGQTILQYDPSCKGAQAYKALAKEVIRRNG